MNQAQIAGNIIDGTHQLEDLEARVAGLEIEALLNEDQVQANAIWSKVLGFEIEKLGVMFRTLDECKRLARIEPSAKRRRQMVREEKLARKQCLALLEQIRSKLQ